MSPPNKTCSFFFFCFFLNFGGNKSSLWGHWYPCFWLLVTSLGFKARVGSLIWALHRQTCYRFPEIHLWCDTCRPHGSQHGSRAVSSTYLWGIGGTRNRELSCVLSVRSGRRSTDWSIPFILNPQNLPWQLYQKYMKDYAEHFGVTPRIQFNTRVVKVKPADDYELTGR